MKKKLTALAFAVALLGGTLFVTTAHSFHKQANDDDYPRPAPTILVN